MWGAPVSTLPSSLSVLYPALARVCPAPEQLGPALQVAAGTTLFHEAAPCQGFPLVLSGEVRVSRSSGDGRMLELYRVVPGELCLVSSACLFRSQPMSASGVTTRDTTLLLIGPTDFARWLEEPVFRSEVLGLFAQRMTDLTALIDAVAFRRLDQRLAGSLLGGGQQLQLTHQALADELGTVREIVTRLLRRFEREGWVELGRERILILDSAALRRRSEAG